MPRIPLADEPPEDADEAFTDDSENDFRELNFDDSDSRGLLLDWPKGDEEARLSSLADFL